jgi:putative transcriptional regulator
MTGGVDVREWLIEKRGDMSQEEVARLIGISRGAYSNIENGKRDPSVTVAKKIAKALSFNWTIFFDDNVVESKQNQSA